MKKILVPIDFSEVSMNALEYALSIAERHYSSVEVIHIYKYPSGDHYMPGQIYTLLSDNEEERAAIAFIEYIKNSSQRVHDLLDKVQVNFNIFMGFVPDGILTYAKEKRADLIVLGTTGASGAKAAFFGSVAGEVMESAYCPVLVIPEKSMGLLEELQ